MSGEELQAFFGTAEQISGWLENKSVICKAIALLISGLESGNPPTEGQFIDALNYGFAEKLIKRAKKLSQKSKEVRVPRGVSKKRSKANDVQSWRSRKSRQRSAVERRDRHCKGAVHS